MDTPSDGMLAENLTMILVLASAEAENFLFIYSFIYSFPPWDRMGFDGTFQLQKLRGEKRNGL